MVISKSKCYMPDCTQCNPPTPTIVPSEALKRLMPDLNKDATCPHSGNCSWTRQDFGFPLSMVIVHLNDYHGWTREAIADWLESLDLDLSFPSDRMDG